MVPENTVRTTESAPVFPPYVDGIHIPGNIAPLNFVLPDSVQRAFVEVSSACVKRTFKIRQEMAFPLSFWKEAVSAVQNGKPDTLRLRIILRGKSDRYNCACRLISCMPHGIPLEITSPSAPIFSV